MGNAPVPTGAKSRTTYVLLGIFLGALGIHNFYAGFMGRAVAQLLITILIGLIGWLIIPLIVVYIWAIVEVCPVSRDGRGVPFA
jgi:TM2 domain-containing membrane protein YozV